MEVLQDDILANIVSSLGQQNYENAQDLAFHSFLVGVVYQRLKIDMIQLRSFLSELSNVVYLCQYLQKQQILNQVYKTLLSNSVNDPAAYIQKVVQELLEEQENTSEKNVNIDVLELDLGQVELLQAQTQDQLDSRQESKQTSNQYKEGTQQTEDIKIVNINEEEISEIEEEKEIEEEEERKENFIPVTCRQVKTEIVSNRQFNNNNINKNNNNINKNNNEEWECEICLETMKGDIWPLECQHIFHRHCLDEYFQTQIKQKKLPVNCPNLYCMIAVAYQDLKEILSKEDFLKFEQFSMNHYLENNADEITCCPTPDCQYAFILDDGQINFNCPSCLEDYCLACRSLFHDGQTCREYQISNNYSEQDRQFENLVKGKKFKQCGKCKMWVEKNEGCDHMTCRCTYQFCYKCGGPFKNCLCTNRQNVSNHAVISFELQNQSPFQQQSRAFVEQRNRTEPNFTVVQSNERLMTEYLDPSEEAKLNRYNYGQAATVYNNYLAQQNKQSHINNYTKRQNNNNNKNNNNNHNNFGANQLISNANDNYHIPRFAENIKQLNQTSQHNKKETVKQEDNSFKSNNLNQNSKRLSNSNNFNNHKIFNSNETSYLEDSNNNQSLINNSNFSINIYNQNNIQCFQPDNNINNNNLDYQTIQSDFSAIKQSTHLVTESSADNQYLHQLKNLSQNFSFNHFNSQISSKSMNGSNDSQTLAKKNQLISVCKQVIQQKNQNQKGNTDSKNISQISSNNVFSKNIDKKANNLTNQVINHNKKNAKINDSLDKNMNSLINQKQNTNLTANNNNNNNKKNNNQNKNKDIHTDSQSKSINSRQNVNEKNEKINSKNNTTCLGTNKKNNNAFNVNAYNLKQNNGEYNFISFYKTMNALRNQKCKTNIEEYDQYNNQIQTPSQKTELLDQNLNHRRSNYISTQNNNNSLIIQKSNLKTD